MSRLAKLLLIFTLVVDVSWSSIIDNEIDDFILQNECSLPEGLRSEIQGYQTIVDGIIQKIVNGKYAGDTYESLLAMTDKFGARPSGSKALEDSIDYMVEQFKQAGLENVHTEEALVPHWIRGYEHAEMISPRKVKMQILGLGTTVGTPRGGIIGDAVVVESFDELSALPTEKVQGKIVVYAQAWEGYGKTAQYRGKGASAAAKKGAIASLIRSATPFSIGSPHTGMQRYEDGVKKIPTACITVEDAMMLLRLYRKGEKITIRIEMEDKNMEPVVSRNTIGELKGTENRSVVILSGHLDSWDVGVGAMDDGGGAFISWKALQYLNNMNLVPRRTLRSILWTSEEYNADGAKAYQIKHLNNERKEINFLMESDIGTFDPLGLYFQGNRDAECILREILKSVVVVSGHLDSWDVGVGAMDDGGGAFISWKAVEYLKAIGLRPKRTIRAILWTGEEYGYVGARAYQKLHEANETDEFNFFIESDIGTFEPLGLDFTGNKEAECIFKEVLKLMSALNATDFATPADGGPDISLWVDRGFPGASLLNKNEKYFWFHHSAGDTMLLEDSKSLDKCTALFAAAAYVIADLSVDFPKNVI